MTILVNPLAGLAVIATGLLGYVIVAATLSII